MRSVLFSVLLTSAVPAIAGQCLTYAGEVALSGTLSKHTFPEQPNYESIAEGDKPATYFFVSPVQAFCVAAGSNTDEEPAESRITRVQLVFANGSGYSQLRPYLGKRVECRGTLFHAAFGHHHSPVLLEHASCHAA